jgi:hypothetical protein
MTGQAQKADFTQAKFKDEVCAKLTIMFDCQNGVSIDVQSYKDFATIDIAEPIVTDPKTGRKVSFLRTTICPAYKATSSSCGCSTNGRCSSPAWASMSRISAAISGC